MIDRIKAILDTETTVGGTSAYKFGEVNSDELARLIVAAMLEGVDIEDMRTRARYLRGYAPKVSDAMYGGLKPSGIWNLNRAADLLDQAANALSADT